MVEHTTIAIAKEKYRAEFRHIGSISRQRHRANRARISGVKVNLTIVLIAAVFEEGEVAARNSDAGDATAVRVLVFGGVLALAWALKVVEALAVRGEVGLVVGSASRIVGRGG